MNWGHIILNVDTLMKMEKPLAPLYLKLVSNQLHCVIPHSSSFSNVKKYQAKGVQNLLLKAEYLPELFKTDAKYSFLSLGNSNVFSQLDEQEIQSIYEKSSSKFQRTGWIAKVLTDAPSWSFTAVTFLSRNNSLGQSLKDSLNQFPSSIEHSFDVLHLALILKIILCGNSNEEICEDVSLFALVHDLGKITIPKDIRNKKIVGLDTNERSIYFSHTQNLSLIVDRDPKISSTGKKLFQTYDLLERNDETYPVKGFEALWCVVIANRLIEGGLLDAGTLTEESFYNSISSIEPKTLFLPVDVWNLLSSNFILLCKRFGFEQPAKMRREG